MVLVLLYEASRFFSWCLLAEIECWSEITRAQFIFTPLSTLYYVFWTWLKNTKNFFNLTVLLFFPPQFVHKKYVNGLRNLFIIESWQHLVLALFSLISKTREFFWVIAFDCHPTVRFIILHRCFAYISTHKTEKFH